MRCNEVEKIIKRQVFIDEDERQILYNADDFLEELACYFDDIESNVVCHLYNEDEKIIDNEIYEVLRSIQNVVDNILSTQ